MANHLLFGGWPGKGLRRSWVGLATGSRYLVRKSSTDEMRVRGGAIVSKMEHSVKERLGGARLDDLGAAVGQYLDAGNIFRRQHLATSQFAGTRTEHVRMCIVGNRPVPVFGADEVECLQHPASVVPMSVTSPSHKCDGFSNHAGD